MLLKKAFSLVTLPPLSMLLHVVHLHLHLHLLFSLDLPAASTTVSVRMH